MNILSSKDCKIARFKSSSESLLVERIYVLNLPLKFSTHEQGIFTFIFTPKVIFTFKKPEPLILIFNIVLISRIIVPE